MKKLLLFPVLISIVFFASCQSLNVGIPGESAVVKNNISSEYYSIASSYENLKNYNKAIEYYTLASKNKNLSASCGYKIARCYALAKDWGNAETEYLKLLKKDPDNVTLKISLAYIHAMNGEVEKGAVLYKELQEQNPTDVSILKNYLSVLISAEKFDEAEKMLSYMKEQFPDENSIADFEKAINASKPKDEIVPSETAASVEKNTENK